MRVFFQEDTNRELCGHGAVNREILTGNFKTPAIAGKFEKSLASEIRQ